MTASTIFNSCRLRNSCWETGSELDRLRSLLLSRSWGTLGLAGNVGIENVGLGPWTLCKWQAAKLRDPRASDSETTEKS